MIVSFGPYVVTNANDNATYHLAELYGTRLAIPATRKKVRIFKEDEPNLDGLNEDENNGEKGSKAEVNEGDIKDGNGREEDKG